MILSMTGFGRAVSISETHKLVIEIKSVNHRYLDLSIKMPRRFNVFEAEMRKTISEAIKRGKLDIYISYEDYKEKASSIRFNKDIARSYIDICKHIENEFELTNNLNSVSLIRLPEVISIAEESDNEQIKSLLLETLTAAINTFNSSRKAEGYNLSLDLQSKLKFMLEQVEFIEEKAPLLIAEYKSKLEEKVSSLLASTSIDEARILTEVTIYADKICVDEEITRLKSHIKAVYTELKNGGAVGRKLDFIAQEMNREANTILSKSTNVDIADRAIALKTEVEKLREQIQNLE